MRNLSYEDQVRLCYSTDIVLGGHGSAMTNVMFMTPHSVLIECNPPFFYEMCFANIAFLSRVHYVSVANYNEKYVPSKLKNAQELYQNGQIFLKRRNYAQLSIYPDYRLVVDAVEDALEYVKRWHLSFRVIDQWSLIFNTYTCLLETYSLFCLARLFPCHEYDCWDYSVQAKGRRCPMECLFPSSEVMSSVKQHS